MKKLMMSLVALMLAVNVNAQKYLNETTPFEKGTKYASAAFSGLDLNYNSSTKWNFEISAKAGYFIQDNLMLLGELGWGLHEEMPNEFGLGAGARYYMATNGIYLGAGLRYRHFSSVDDFMPNVNVGYTFFLSRSVTIEPELYYDISTKSFKDYSGLGFRVGFGIYL